MNHLESFLRLVPTSASQPLLWVFGYFALFRSRVGFCCGLSFNCACQLCQFSILLTRYGRSFSAAFDFVTPRALHGSLWIPSHHPSSGLMCPTSLPFGCLTQPWSLNVDAGLQVARNLDGQIRSHHTLWPVAHRNPVNTRHPEGKTGLKSPCVHFAHKLKISTLGKGTLGFAVQTMVVTPFLPPTPQVLQSWLDHCSLPGMRKQISVLVFVAFVVSV